MKKFMIFYAVFSVIFLAFVFLITIIQESNSRSLNLFYILADEAKESNNLEEFVKYQSVAYQKYDQIETDDYSFHIYQVIAQIDDEYINQFSIFVLPKGDINSASVLSDSNDHTGITLIDHDSSDVIYETASDSDYDDYAVSYGIERIGFYYYAVNLDQSYTLDITLKDYNAQNILDETLIVDYITYNPNNLGTLTLGFTDTEIQELLNLSAYIQPALMKNILIFLVSDIVVGAIINFILKKKIIK